ncbi:MAG: ribosome-associated heat shock protein Hsp15 [Miltoncostaeaceae bacterium]|jgi:ribosome-associated heat shock protein Hsp15|nr:ribosome-associated heat shock protein Hsp15 [Miltoncostaeaceae bacterium]
MAEAPERVRIDKWLWAARFVKTRALAVEAIQGGRVEVNGARAKPGKEVRAGDRVEISFGPTRWSVVVLVAGDRRGPASQAALLYEETAESRERREQLAAERRFAGALGADLGARPTKRDRRRIEALRSFMRNRPD